MTSPGSAVRVPSLKQGRTGLRQRARRSWQPRRPCRQTRRGAGSSGSPCRRSRRQAGRRPRPGSSGGQVHGGLTPTEESTAASGVVGSWTYRMPRRYTAAAKPAMSLSDAAAQGGHAVRAGQMLRRQEPSSSVRVERSLRPSPEGKIWEQTAKPASSRAAVTVSRYREATVSAGQNGDPPLSQQRGPDSPRTGQAGRCQCAHHRAAGPGREWFGWSQTSKNSFYKNHVTQRRRK